MCQVVFFCTQVILTFMITTFFLRPSISQIVPFCSIAFENYCFHPPNPCAGHRYVIGTSLMCYFQWCCVVGSVSSFVHSSGCPVTEVSHWYLDVSHHCCPDWHIYLVAFSLPGNVVPVSECGLRCSAIHSAVPAHWSPRPKNLFQCGFCLLLNTILLLNWMG